MSKPPKGMTINADGYLRITSTRNGNRHKYAHRAYADRQFMHSLGRHLRDDEECHHLCGNRQCWPPSDFHMVIMSEALHHASEAGRAPWRKRRARRKKGKR